MVAHEGSSCCSNPHPTYDESTETPPQVDSSPPHAEGSEIDVSKDGGVIKKVLVAGTGER